MDEEFVCDDGDNRQRRLLLVLELPQLLVEREDGLLDGTPGGGLGTREGVFQGYLHPFASESICFLF